MVKVKVFLGLVCAVAIGLSGCSREQSDWEKARAANNSDAYELFVKKYPSGSFTAQAQARLKELYEERDWQKARDSDTPDAYQAFLKQYPEGKWAQEARIRVENFSLAQAPLGAPAAASAVPPEGESALPASPNAAATAAAPAAPNPAAAPKPAAAPPVAAAPATAAAAGAYGVQLGAFSSGKKAAEKHWATLQKKSPKLLAGLTPKIHSSKTSKGTVYRLQVAGLSKTQALAICKDLKGKSQACTVLKPAHHGTAHKRHK
jgi:cell division protein FtsN